MLDDDSPLTGTDRTVVIVGTGVAGATAALTLRAEGFDGRVLLVGEEPEEPYRRPPLSKDVLRGSMPPERTRLKPSGTWSDQGIELLPGTRVTALDVQAHEVQLVPAAGTAPSGGRRLRYDRLLLAPGGRPRWLPGAGRTAPQPHVHTLRTLADVPALQADLTPGAHLLVVGAGLVGAEVAASARALGCDVTLLEAAPTPLPRLLPPVLAAGYAGLHRAHGVTLHTGVHLERLDGTAGSGVVATATDGRRWRADAALVAVGMVPRVGLAARAGLAVDTDGPGGILVDAYGRTSQAGIYAAGDAANQPNLTLGGRQRVEHWQHGQETGAAAARSILGRGSPYATIPWCWSDQYGVNLQFSGWPAVGAATRWVVRGDLDGFDFTALFVREHRLVGAVAANRPGELRAARRLIEVGAHADLSALADPGSDLTALAAAAPVSG
ncbi:MAG TPA: FAD-dependent oxidoreductase [Frankiaceae bacterium]